MNPQRQHRTSFAAFVLAIVIAFSGSVGTPQVALAASSTVYVAPYSGTRYHCIRSCRGLRRARSIQRMTKRNARAAGYTKCRICY